MSASTGERQIPGYDILNLLGEGGMGEVWLARRQGSSQLSVVKWMNEQAASREDLRARFLREAQLMTLLHHPNVVGVRDAGWVQGQFYLTTEFVKGIELQALFEQLTAKGPPPAGFTVSLIVQVLNGLEAAHDLQDPEGKALEVVHRDLSPRNILLGFDGRARIIDFGLAHGAIGTARTIPGTMMGTLGYMSPEQCRGAPIDRRADLYAVGAILYALLTARPLLWGKDRMALMTDLIRGVEPEFRDEDHVPSAMQQVVRRAVAKDPARRYPDAASLRQALLRAGPEPWSESEISAFLDVRFGDRRQELESELTYVISDVAEVTHTHAHTMTVPLGPMPRPERLRIPMWGFVAAGLGAGLVAASLWLRPLEPLDVTTVAPATRAESNPPLRPIAPAAGAQAVPRPRPEPRDAAPRAPTPDDGAPATGQVEPPADPPSTISAPRRRAAVRRVESSEAETPPAEAARSERRRAEPMRPGKALRASVEGQVRRIFADTQDADRAVRRVLRLADAHLPADLAAKVQACLQHAVGMFRDENTVVGCLVYFEGREG